MLYFLYILKNINTPEVMELPRNVHIGAKLVNSTFL